MASAAPELNRKAIERAAQALIDLLDVIDGDNDLEANGDELDGSMGEDDFHDQYGTAPGCPVSDPGGDPLDFGEREEGVLVPIYAIDQSQGPTNVTEAVQDWYRRRHEADGHAAAKGLPNAGA